MIVTLSENCPIFETRNQMHLNHLLYSLVRGWNLLANPSPARLESLMPTGVWDVYGQYITESYKMIVNMGGSIVGPANCSECEPHKLAEFLNLPCVVLVENAQSDKAFLDLIIDKLRPRLRRAISSPIAPIQVANGGGITVLFEEIPRKAADYTKYAIQGLPARFVVLVDGDRRRPKQMSPEAQKVVKCAADHGVDVHVLLKRSIENYVPDAALEAYASRLGGARRDAIEQVLQLSQTARDHYPMKGGLPEKTTIEAEELYPPNFPRRVGIGDFFEDLVRLERGSVTASGLKSRDGASELDQILDLLERNT